MNTINLIIATGGGVELPTAQASVISLELDKYSIVHCSSFRLFDVNTGVGYIYTPPALSFYKKAIVFRNGVVIPATAAFAKLVYALYGNFNYDNIKLSVNEGFLGRVEVRNENGVLLADNGVAWPDGTYPPDAKNRAGLTGLHAAVINKELDDALTGDVTNKEAELNEMERGDGVQHALEKDEDNGL